MSEIISAENRLYAPDLFKWWLGKNDDPDYYGDWEAGLRLKGGEVYRRYRLTAVGALVALLWALIVHLWGKWFA